MFILEYKNIQQSTSFDLSWVQMIVTGPDCMYNVRWISGLLIIISSPLKQMPNQTGKCTFYTKYLSLGFCITDGLFVFFPYKQVPKPERKRKGPGSVVGQVIQDDEDDDGPSSVKRVASTVELHRR